MRPFTIAATLLLALSGLAVPAMAGDLRAEDASVCAPDVVTVVVDAEMIDGELEVRCVEAADDATVLDAVTDAGFDVEGTAEFGSSIVCRVDGAPDQTREPCDSMPAADAYWISWVGTDDGWTFAQEAVDAQGVSAGDVVALAFQEGADERQPAISPQEARDAAEPAPGASEAVVEDEGTTSWFGIVLGAAAVVLLALVLMWLVRRRAANS
ncbi:hypothetical protein [Aeromicrobium sp. CTD01-1L150]|uniref:hypothetical protein n=1 Tax=Aeromicrobium sp. CTD01-1L150 TaxID=3341830 RepID=UPI0035C075E2